VTKPASHRLGRLQARLVGFVRGHVPTREQFDANRWLRPVAHLVLRPELWRFTRRSVPRGVALGTFIGIAVPFGHSPLAAVAAVVFGANVPVAFVTTWLVSNPLTWTVLWPVAWRVGHVLVDVDRQAGLGAMPGMGEGGPHHHWLRHITALVSGLVIEAAALAAVGFLASNLVWRWRVKSRWRARLRHRGDARGGR